MTVYRLNIEGIKQLDMDRLRSLMPERMRKADRYKHEDDRLLSIGGGYLIMKCLGLRDEKELSIDEYGKPYAEGYPDFSISHSGEEVVLIKAEPEDGAEAGSIVGVDIELIRDRNLNVIRKVFNEEEQSWIYEGSDDESDAGMVSDRFHILWTLKEAVMKALGLGFRLPPRSFSVLAFQDKGWIEVSGRKLYLYSEKYGDYYLGVCTSYEVDEISIKSL